MEKTIVLKPADFSTWSLRNQADRENLFDALRGKFDGTPYVLSKSGILYEGLTGHTEISFKHQQLFLRFSQACHAAQVGFIECAYGYLDREKVETIFIQVDWSASDKQRNITATLSGGGGHRKLVFDLP